jgi:hypothetical protein
MTIYFFYNFLENLLKTLWINYIFHTDLKYLVSILVKGHLLKVYLHFLILFSTHENLIANQPDYHFMYENIC